MCDGCERPSTIWGVDAAGVAVARRVSERLARTTPHAHPGFDGLAEGYYNVLSDTPPSLPEGLGIGLVVYMGSDLEALSATRHALAARTRPQELSVAVFLGPRASAPSAGPVIAATNGEHAASVVAALAEAMVLGPTQIEPRVRWANLPQDPFAHVVSGFVSQASLTELFSPGQPLGWGVGRGRGKTAVRTVVRQALNTPNWPVLPMDGSGPHHGVIVARIGADLEPSMVRFMFAMYLPRSLRWRVAVFRADELEPDEIEIVALGDEVRQEPKRRFGV